MHLLPVLLASIVLASGNVIPNAEHQTLLETFFGKPVNMTIINDIIADEAKKLGIPAQQHFKSCLLEEEIYEKTQTEEGGKEFLEQVGNMRFTSVDSVMDELKAKAPKAHAAFIATFKKTSKGLGQEAAAFVVNLKDALIKMLYDHVMLSARTRESMQSKGKALKKVIKMKSSWNSIRSRIVQKMDFEKNTCFRTGLRIVDATGAEKGKITQIKNYIQDLIDFA